MLFLQSAFADQFIIRGKVFTDRNVNCLADSTDVFHDRWIVVGEKGVAKNYAITQPDGSYELIVENLGTHTIRAIQPVDLWAVSCVPPGLPVVINANDSIINNVDLAFEDSLSCHYLAIDIGTAHLETCSQNRWTVNYRNFGNDTVYWNAVFARFDHRHFPVSTTSANWFSFYEGNVRFGQDTLFPGVVKRFTFTDSLECAASDSATISITAEHLPNYVLNPCPVMPGPVWDGSRLTIYSTCETDSVKFKIWNKGNGDMDNQLRYDILEDWVIFQTDSIQLTSGDSLIVRVPANGKTWIAEMQQPPGFPGNPEIRSVVEGCGTGNFSYKIAGTVENDGSEDFRDMECVELFTMNDQLVVSPSGFNRPHISTVNNIRADDELEYTIRFQNTTTDTIENIVIIDTLDNQKLDAATIKAWGASHDHRFTLRGNAVLKWEMNNIQLPPVSLDEPNSRGFVKFKVSQLPNMTGTIISNCAQVYFDGQLAFTTNKTQNTISNQLFIDTTMVRISTFMSDPPTITASPNPFDTYVNFHLNGINSASVIDFFLFNVLGEKVRQLQINGISQFSISSKGLKNGVYFYEFHASDKWLVQGKLILNR